MKYVEEQGRKPFDWWGFLNKENKTDEDWEKAKNLSRDWVTCGCGNKDARIKRYESGAPFDTLMYNLGTEFPYCISEGNYKKAKEILSEIDQREIELIQEYEENLKTA